MWFKKKKEDQVQEVKQHQEIVLGLREGGSFSTDSLDYEINKDEYAISSSINVNNLIVTDHFKDHLGDDINYHRFETNDKDTHLNVIEENGDNTVYVWKHEMTDNIRHGTEYEYIEKDGHIGNYLIEYNDLEYFRNIFSDDEEWIEPISLNFQKSNKSKNLLMMIYSREIPETDQIEFLKLEFDQDNLEFSIYLGLEIDKSEIKTL